MWGHWYPLFRTSDNSAQEFQSQGGSIVTYALLSLACNDPQSHLWWPGPGIEHVTGTLLQMNCQWLVILDQGQDLAWRFSAANFDKVLYEEMMTNNDNLESNLLTSSLLKIPSLYKFCYKLHMLSQMSV